MTKISEYLKRKKEQLYLVFSSFKKLIIVFVVFIILISICTYLDGKGNALFLSILQLIIVFLQFYMLMSILSIAINGLLTEYVSPIYKDKTDEIKAFIAIQKYNLDSSHITLINQYIQKEKRVLQKKSAEDIRLIKKVRDFKNKQKKESISLAVCMSISAILCGEIIKRLLDKVLIIEHKITFDYMFFTALYLILLFIFLSQFSEIFKKLTLYRHVKEFDKFIYKELFEDEK